MSRIYTLAILLTVLLASASVTEAKGPPEGKGKSGKKPSVEEQLDAVETAYEQKTKEDKQKKKQEKLKGLEKQQVKKSEQVQKELDKGSEQGQAMREKHRKKWWKFGFGSGEKETVPTPAPE